MKPRGLANAVWEQYKREVEQTAQEAGITFEEARQIEQAKQVFDIRLGHIEERRKKVTGG